MDDALRMHPTKRKEAKMSMDEFPAAPQIVDRRSKTIDLKRPVNDGGKIISSLTIREPTAGDLCVGDAFKGATQQRLAMYSAITDVKLTVIKALSLTDLNELTEVAAAMMGEDLAAAGDE